MFPEFHGYIIDYKKRHLDFTKYKKTFIYIGEWEEHNDYLRCYVGWTMLNHNRNLYTLAKYDLHMQTAGTNVYGEEFPINKITWNGDEPNDYCMIL